MLSEYYYNPRLYAWVLGGYVFYCLSAYMEVVAELATTLVNKLVVMSSFSLKELSLSN